MERVQATRELLKHGFDRKIIVLWTDEKLEDKYLKLINKNAKEK